METQSVGQEDLKNKLDEITKQLKQAKDDWFINKGVLDLLKVNKAKVEQCSNPLALNAAQQCYLHDRIETVEGKVKQAADDFYGCMKKKAEIEKQIANGISLETKTTSEPEPEVLRI